MPLRDLEGIADEIAMELDEIDAVREVSIKSCRTIIRMSGSIVHRVHKEEDVDASLRAALEEVDRLRCLLDDHPLLWNSGMVNDAMQEASEAAILVAILRGERVPTPHELSVPSRSYVTGLADSIGEMRRISLECLRNGMVEEAESHLDQMEVMYHTIMRFDYPDAIVAIRRKQDIARSLLEKTRGEVAVAKSNRRLEDLLREVSSKL